MNSGTISREFRFNGVDAEWADRRVRLGLEECFRCGIHPLAWETPHYSASASNYHAFAKYFDTFYDRVMSAELAGTQQLFPYPVRLREYGVTVVPENLGYVEINNPDPSLILRGAERMKVVRDGIASFFFHPFVPIVHLKTIVRGLKNEGWVFQSIRDFPCNLRTESCWVTSEGGEGKIVLANQYAHVLHLDRKGKVMAEDFCPGPSLGCRNAANHPRRRRPVSFSKDWMSFRPSDEIPFGQIWPG